MQKIDNSYAHTVFIDYCNSTHNELRAHVSLQRYTSATWYTPTWRAAFIIAHGITSLSPYVYTVSKTHTVSETLSFGTRTNFP